MADSSENLKKIIIKDPTKHHQKISDSQILMLWLTINDKEV